MRPLKLVLDSIHSFRGVHELDLSGVNLAVLSGPNGAGKSTLAVDALRFALFGATRGPLDSIISEGEDSGRVEVVFALGSATYRVSRARSRKGAGSTVLSFAMLSEDGPDTILDGKTVAETQTRIERLLRMTDALFTATACANQGNAAAFSQAKPAERKAVLGEILDLGAWERRAEAARQKARDTAALADSLRDTLGRVEEKAAEADGLRSRLTDLAGEEAAASARLAAEEQQLAEAQAAKEVLVRQQEEWLARRRELAYRETDLERARADRPATEFRLADARRVASRRDQVIAQLRQAEQAQTYAQELEAQRQRIEQLDHEAALLTQRRDAERKDHGRQVEAAERRIADARHAYVQELTHLREQIERLDRQGGALEQVPCAGLSGGERELCLTNCPLLGQAHEARAEVQPLKGRLTQLETEEPWAAEEAKFATLQEAEPGRLLSLQLLEVTARREEIGFDAAEFAEAKRVAAGRPTCEEALRAVERAEAQEGELAETLMRLDAEIEALTRRVEEIRADLGPPDLEVRITLADEAVVKSRALVSLAQGDLRRLGQEKGGVQERLRAAEEAKAEAEQLTADAAKAGRRAEVLKVLAQAFGKAGIPALLIEKAVPDLEAVANEVLATLSDGRLSLSLISQRETKAKTLSETLEIVIADGSASLTTGERGARPYESFSGGEAMRVDLALRVGLSTLLAHRAGARCELLVLDEVAAPLDAEGRLLFVDCLTRIADRFATVLCITHTEDLKDAFPICLQVSKGDAGSRVEIIRR